MNKVVSFFLFLALVIGVTLVAYFNIKKDPHKEPVVKNNTVITDTATYTTGVVVMTKLKTQQDTLEQERMVYLLKFRRALHRELTKLNQQQYSIEQKKDLVLDSLISVDRQLDDINLKDK